MIRLSLAALVVLLALSTYSTTQAEIKNGYAQNLTEANLCMRNLESISAKGALKQKRKNFEKRYKIAAELAENIRFNYWRTEQLIRLLQKVDPGLYREINTVRDGEGKETDVYVKVVDNLKENIVGTTNLRQSTNNHHTYASEYGNYTVSVKVAYSNTPWKTLKRLVHELGHVRYQVPNLAMYWGYFQDTYLEYPTANPQLGHYFHDPSHRSVLNTTKEFNQYLKSFLSGKNQLSRKWFEEVLASIKKPES